MSDTRVNLATSLNRISMALSAVATALPALETNQEIERQAQLLDHIAEEACDGATILRVLAARRQRERLAQFPANVPCDAASDYQADGAS